MKCLPESSFSDITGGADSGFASQNSSRYLLHHLAGAPDSLAFQAGWVKVSWSPTVLNVYAVLEDQDIHNPVQQHHVPAFSQGDVFEIFLKPEGQESYREFHVTPDNFKFQLNIPSPHAFASNTSGNIPEDWIIRDRLFESQVKCLPELNQWQLHASIPFAMVVDAGTDLPQAGSRWRVSFSRYDYSRGSSVPVLSSTSRHAEVNFHRQQEWALMEFC